MNLNEAKTILSLYRPGAGDEADPQIAGAMALAKKDPELARWFEEHCARQIALRAKFRQITVPEGLKEQIISEQAARRKAAVHQRMALAAVAVAIVVLTIISLEVFHPFRERYRPDDYRFATYRTRMVDLALRGYNMDLATNTAAPIVAYLSRSQAPADFELPASLQKVALTGCAVTEWHNRKGALICFHTSRPVQPGNPSDLWLFVIDPAAVENPPASGPPQFARVHHLMTATWVQGNKLYVLGMDTDKQTLQKYL